MFSAEIRKNISFLSENFQFLEVKFSIYLNRHVFAIVLVRLSLHHCILRFETVLHITLRNGFSTCTLIPGYTLCSFCWYYSCVVMVLLLMPRESCASCIRKTCLYNGYPIKPHFYIVKLGFTGVYIIFHISAQKIDCGYSLEPPRRGGSNEYPQSIFWAEIWKILEFSIWKTFSFWWWKFQYIWIGVFS